MNELLPMTRMAVQPAPYSNDTDSVRGKVTFAGERPVTLNKTNQADAVLTSLARRTSSIGCPRHHIQYEGCIPCMLRKARALCVDQRVVFGLSETRIRMCTRPV